MAEWTLHRQPKDQIADHEYSIWCDGEPVVLANIMPGEDGVLATIVKAVNNHGRLIEALNKIAWMDEFLNADAAREMMNIAREALSEVQK